MEMFTLTGWVRITLDGSRTLKPSESGVMLGGPGKQIPMEQAKMLGLTPLPTPESIEKSMEPAEDKESTPAEDKAVKGPERKTRHAKEFHERRK